MISFIIPCYNEEKHIRECIRSIKSNIQYIQYEIIVVDNNCSDDTAKIANEEQVTVIEEKRKGVVFARQAGYENAKGDLIANIDADSKITKGWVWVALKQILNDDVIAVTGPLEYENSSSSLKLLTKIFYWAANISNKYVGVFLQGGNSMIKKSALDAVNGYDLNIAFYGEDTMTAKRIQHLGKIVFEPDLISISSPRRINEQGLVKTIWLYLINYLSVTFKDKSLTNDYKDHR